MKNMSGNDQFMAIDDSLRGSGILPVGAASRRDSVSIAPRWRSHAALRFKSVPLALVSCPPNHLPCRRVFSRLAALQLLPIALLLLVAAPCQTQKSTPTRQVIGGTGH